LVTAVAVRSTRWPVFSGAAVRQAPLGPAHLPVGKAAVLVEVDTEDDLASVHAALAAAGEPVPVLVLGNGSNMLVADTA